LYTFAADHYPEALVDILAQKYRQMRFVLCDKEGYLSLWEGGEGILALDHQTPLREIRKIAQSYRLDDFLFCRVRREAIMCSGGWEILEKGGVVDIQTYTGESFTLQKENLFQPRRAQLLLAAEAPLDDVLLLDLDGFPFWLDLYEEGAEAPSS
jgi:hypothetical protein